jgi:hypothetical protein
VRLICCAFMAAADWAQAVSMLHGRCVTEAGCVDASGPQPVWYSCVVASWPQPVVQAVSVPRGRSLCGVGWVVPLAAARTGVLEDIVVDSLQLLVLT